MAAATALGFCTSTLFFNSSQSLSQRSRLLLQQEAKMSRRRTMRPMVVRALAYKVEMEHEGAKTTLEVEEDETILEKALEMGLSIPHDCKLGVCMTCPAKLVSGSVDQSDGMLSEDVVERGYALLCASYPRSDCRIRTIPEEELLSLQLATAND
ncbi:2Fe-2S ferredoxin-type domain-containing protein [Cinnamomum micranthum f. kanehirae]|uniref:Ferredoxin n=1 Tax=Cinnamomum micranthum f. kanehirae TaxID=337451 RepID=A0A3S3MEM1_9MAGN|nr:2Fe-2S ferredoxin-type domain-containing protein [Cinnamomum micranthum f. kanehirae]